MTRITAPPGAPRYAHPEAVEAARVSRPPAVRTRQVLKGGAVQMGIFSRSSPLLAAIGLLALGTAPSLQAQDTSAAARPDTAGYEGYKAQTDTSAAGQATMGTDTTAADTAGRVNKEGQEGYKYHGPGSDSVLDAKPGVQTGPAAGDSGAASQAGAGTADTVVCKDGSNAAKSSKCKQHGGIDKAATRAAMNARGHMQGADSSATPADTGARSGTDTGQVNQSGAGSYQYNGPPSDTALKAKPGTQTGADTGAAGRSDSSAREQTQGP